MKPSRPTRYTTLTTLMHVGACVGMLALHAHPITHKYILPLVFTHLIFHAI